MILRYIITLRAIVIRGVFLTGGVLLTLPAFSQGIHNESSIHVHGTGLYVDGDMNNNGVLVNYGEVAFTGDWSSEGRYKGSGVVNASGRGTQKIFHHDQPISRLHVNGWGAKYIKGKLRITGTLALTAGIVHVSPGDMLKLEDGAEVSGGSTDSHVEGAITTEGTGYRFFPVGKNGTYAPIEFLDVRGDDPQYAVEAFENPPPVAVDGAIVRGGLYWERRDAAGDFLGTAIAIQYDPSDFQDAANMILITGESWGTPFTKVPDVAKSPEAPKITTLADIRAPIIMLGEISSQWREADFYLSTALSPHAMNHDNRKVKIFGERLAGDAFRFTVFDRWGSIVYESTSLEHMATNGWDGRGTDGSELISGTYPYRLTAIARTGQAFEKKGVITIIY